MPKSLDSSDSYISPSYDYKPNMDDPPYEQRETTEYTEQTIASQKRRLIKDALNYGLKLKALDQGIET